MSTYQDYALGQLSRVWGARKGAHLGVAPNPEKVAEADREIQRIKALRARVRADEELVAAGIDPAKFEAVLAQVLA